MLGNGAFENALVVATFVWSSPQIESGVAQPAQVSVRGFREILVEKELHATAS